ncbi:hypothetical protein MKEN_00462900 [Mycena kentingensis (nom. inval.)]|nr:hypothetical protein MKEN_00462900 [Mycena kentingensis (nom. inval.)]
MSNLSVTGTGTSAFAFPAGITAERYCQDTSSLPADVCPGLCINQDVSGAPAIITFIAASIVTSIAMIWLPKNTDRRHQLALHELQSWSRIVNGFVSYRLAKINNFDVYLLLLLVIGAETTTLVGAASRLHIIEYHWFVGLVKSLAPLAAIIALAVVAAPQSFQDAQVKATLAAYVGRGSQPACFFPLKIAFHAVGGVFLIIMLVTVLFSYTGCFGRRVRSIVPCDNSATTDDNRPMWAMYFWTVIVLVLNIVWVAFVWYYIKSYLQDDALLNKEVLNDISASQIFSIFLSAASLVPPLKHILDQIKQKLELGEHAAEMRQMFADAQDDLEGLKAQRDEYSD